MEKHLWMFWSALVNSQIHITWQCMMSACLWRYFHQCFLRITLHQDHLFPKSKKYIFLMFRVTLCKIHGKKIRFSLKNKMLKNQNVSEYGTKSLQMMNLSKTTTEMNDVWLTTRDMKMKKNHQPFSNTLFTMHFLNKTLLLVLQK